MNQLQKINNPLDKITQALNTYKERIAQALPQGRSVEQEISSILATVSSDNKLQRCSPESIAQACFDAASLGLPVNKLGLAYLVPYGEQAKLLIGYRGYLDIALRSGIVLDIFAECVYSKDKFRYLAGTAQDVVHEPVIVGDRGELVAVYAVARLCNGITKPCIMRKAEVDFIRSKSRSVGNSPWASDYDEMAKKTVVKRLCKMLPHTCLPERLHQVEDREDIIDVELERDEQINSNIANVANVVSKPTNQQNIETVQPVQTIKTLSSLNPSLSPKQKRIARIKELLERERALIGYNADVVEDMELSKWSIDKLNKYGSDLGERVKLYEGRGAKAVAS